MEENKDRKLWLIMPTHDNSGLIQSDRHTVRQTEGHLSCHDGETQGVVVLPHVH